jgi:chitodextrinase
MIPTSFYIPSSVSQLQVVPESDYKAEFLIDSDWSTGFTGRINLTNLTNEPIKDWKLEFDFDNSISSIWNGTINSHNGNHYVIGNNQYNQNIMPGSAETVGFTGSPGKVTNVPTNYTLFERVDINDCSGIDTDADGLNNSLELSLGTNAYLTDTDGDGLTDGVEVELGLNPLMQNSVDDADNIAPSVPTDLMVTELTDNSISITWQASADNKAVCGYDVYINDAMVGTVTTTSYQALNLNPNTTYHIIVTAKDSAGNASQASTALEVTTKQIADTQAPSVPTGLSATLLTNTTVHLNWNESTDNVGISQYDIYCNDKLLDTVAETSYTYAGLEEESIYQFYIVARDFSENTSIPSDMVNISTTDTQAPTIIADLQEISNTDTAVTLSWSCSTDNVGVTGYKIYRNNTIIADTADTTYTDEPAELGITYEYMVRAYDAAGNESVEGNRISVTLKDTSAPSVPTNLVCIDKTDSSISLKWDASSDNTRVGGYDIYVNSEKVGVVTEGTEYVLSGLMYSTEYSITVYAWDENGNISEASNTMVVATIPETVINLNAVYGEQGVTIEWDPVSGVTGYELKINENIIEVGNVASYIQTQVLPMSQYRYEVRSVNGTDVSEWSEPVSLFTPPAKVDNLTARVGNNSTIELQWDAVDNAMSYEIEINGMIAATVDTTTYIDNNINSKEANNYRIRAVNGEYKGLWSDSVLKANCVVIKEGTIDRDTVWEKANGCYYVEGNVTIAEGVSLQILPGTLIKFAPGVGMIVEGSLAAEGTEDMPIIFTSVKDPEYGGSGLYGTTDYWREITVGETGTFTADYIRIKDGGYYSDTDNSTLCELYVQGKLSLNYSIVSDSAQQGIQIATAKDISIQNSTIEGS